MFHESSDAESSCWSSGIHGSLKIPDLKQQRTLSRILEELVEEDFREWRMVSLLNTFLFTFSLNYLGSKSKSKKNSKLYSFD